MRDPAAMARRFRSMHGVSRAALIAALALAMQLPQVVAAEAPSNRRCAECHGVAGERPAGEKPDGMSIYLGDWDHSVHSGLACVDCHTGIARLPHEVPVPKAQCASCHDAEVASYAASPHSTHAASGDSLAPSCASCHDPHSVRPPDQPESVLHRMRVARVCTRCHSDQNAVGGREFAVPQPATSYLRGVHAQAVAAGNPKAATCGDCHDSHAVRRAQDPESMVFRQHIPKTCGQCHAQEEQAYDAGVHGRATARGSSDSPVCNTCHGEHAVLHLGEPGVTTVVASETCESCHSNATLARRYGLPPSAVASYEDSYHGLAARGGLAKAAGCTSCHGVHRILPKSDPESSVNPARLTETCRVCHRQATPAFAISYAHGPHQPTSGERAASRVRSIYVWVILLIIGGMALHNLLILGHDLRASWRQHRARAVHERLTRFEVRQHFMLLLSFFLLVITGFALRYPETAWARGLAAIGLDETARRVLHRGAAVLMIAASLLHLVYMFTRRGREQIREMLPRIQDAHQALENIDYHLGRRSRPPEFARFRYIEKAEYWALVWGTVVMVGTGLILWFPEQLDGPAWLVKVAEAVHFYEAWLAFLAIVIWHLFFVLLRPGWQGSFTAFTGHMDPEELAHEHPAEYASRYGPVAQRRHLPSAPQQPVATTDQPSGRHR